MLRVRELNPTNTEATKALSRIEKAIKNAHLPDFDDIEIKLGKIKDLGN